MSSYIVLQTKGRPSACTVRLLPGRSVTIGRDPQNDVVVNESFCSREHAVVEQVDGGWRVRDLGSRNGTRVEGRTIRKGETVPLWPGQIIQIGDTTLQFVDDLDDAFSIDDGQSPSRPIVIDRLRQTQYFRPEESLDEDDEDGTQASMPVNRLCRLVFQVATANDVKHAAAIGLQAILEGTMADSGAVHLVDNRASGCLSSSQMREVVSRPGPCEDRHRISPYLASLVLRSRAALLARNIIGDDLIGQSDSFSEIQTTSIICAPVRCGPHIVGLLNVYSTSTDAVLDSQDLEFVLAVADTMGFKLAQFDELAEAAEEKRQARQALHESQQQLFQAQKMESIGRLAAGVAHDFNNILSVILGYGQLAQRQLSVDSPEQQMVAEIVKAGERASWLTDQLLAFSRKQVARPVVLDLFAVIKELHGVFNRLIAEDIQLDIFGPRMPAHARIDRAQLEQVIINLVVNSRDAMPGGGSLRIEVSCVDAADEATPPVCVEVTDTGCGMDESTQQQIFEPFFTTKEPGRGTGLGLATAYGIVAQNNGRIEVTSRLGAGTTFTVYLPRADCPTTPSIEVRQPERLLGGTETILLVEDDEALLQLARDILTRYGYRVLQARHGIEATVVSECHEDRIDLLLTDMVMPQMGGRILADRLTVTRPEMRVLLMSGFTNDAIPDDRGFLAKPFTPESLVHSVRHVLDGSIDATTE